MIYALLIVLSLSPATKTRQLPDKEILRRGNFVVAATLDGYLCYGTKTPLSAQCLRAVAEPSGSEQLQENTQAASPSLWIGNGFPAESKALPLILLLGIAVCGASLPLFSFRWRQSSGRGASDWPGGNSTDPRVKTDHSASHHKCFSVPVADRELSRS